MIKEPALGIERLAKQIRRLSRNEQTACIDDYIENLTPEERAWYIKLYAQFTNALRNNQGNITRACSSLILDGILRDDRKYALRFKVSCRITNREVITPKEWGKRKLRRNSCISLS